MASKPQGGVSGETIWMDGEFIDWDDANVHILTHTLHYGLGVFEGIRCYRTEDGRSAIFQLHAHVRRLFASAHINLLEIPYTRDEVCDVVIASLGANHLAEGYIRPLVFIGEGAMGLNPADNPIRLAVMAWPWGSYLGEEGMERGIRAKVSTFSRHHVNSKMTKGKTCGDYVNSILAKREALLDGYDEAIMLDTHGLVSEASGENIFLVRDDRLYTPPLPTVLDGITRAAVLRGAGGRGSNSVAAPAAARPRGRHGACRSQRPHPGRYRHPPVADPGVRAPGRRAPRRRSARWRDVIAGVNSAHTRRRLRRVDRGS